MFEFHVFFHYLFAVWKLALEQVRSQPAGSSSESPRAPSPHGYEWWPLQQRQFNAAEPTDGSAVVAERGSQYDWRPRSSQYSPKRGHGVSNERNGTLLQGFAPFALDLHVSAGNGFIKLF
jgi:hypothetical protein